MTRVIIKVSHHDDVRRITFASLPSYTELKHSVGDLFALPALTLKYFDEDHDLITISSDNDLREAVTVLVPSSNDRQMLRLFIQAPGETGDHIRSSLAFSMTGSFYGNPPAQVPQYSNPPTSAPSAQSLYGSMHHFGGAPPSHVPTNAFAPESAQNPWSAQSDMRRGINAIPPANFLPNANAPNSSNSAANFVPPASSGFISSQPTLAPSNPTHLYSPSPAATNANAFAQSGAPNAQGLYQFDPATAESPKPQSAQFPPQNADFSYANANANSAAQTRFPHDNLKPSQHLDSPVPPRSAAQNFEFPSGVVPQSYSPVVSHFEHPSSPVASVSAPNPFLNSPASNSNSNSVNSNNSNSNNNSNPNLAKFGLAFANDAKSDAQNPSDVKQFGSANSDARFPSDIDPYKPDANQSAEAKFGSGGNTNWSSPVNPYWSGANSNSNPNSNANLNSVGSNSSFGAQNGSESALGSGNAAPANSGSNVANFGGAGRSASSAFDVADSGVANEKKVDYNSHFMKDVSIPDLSEVNPNEEFEKVWLMKNIGEKRWPEKTGLAWTAGDKIVPVPGSELIPEAQPNESVRISVRLKAPSTPGRYVSYYRMALDKDGRKFGHRIWADIVVKDPNAIVDAPVGSQANSSVNLGADQGKPKEAQDAPEIPEIYRENLAHLASMGFSVEIAFPVLRQYGNDVTEALSHLLDS